MKTLALLALAVEGAALVVLVHRALAAQVPADWATDERTLRRLATLGRAHVPASSEYTN